MLELCKRMSGKVTRHDTPAKKVALLKAFAELGTITHAAEAAGIDRSAHTRWMKDDPEYASAFQEARQSLLEKLEREAIRRAAEGVDKPIYQGGQLVGQVREYSDTLLIFLLKANARDKYGDRLKADVTITREDRIDAVMRALNIDREEAEQAVAEAERIVAG